MTARCSLIPLPDKLPGICGTILGLLAIATVSCSDSAIPPRSDQAEQRISVDANLARLPSAIDSAARYLATNCDEQGRFTYRIQLDSDDEDGSQYNVLRHAGAVYALAQYCQGRPDPQVRTAMLRAATFLRRQCIAPVAGNPNLLAVWSEPAITGKDEPRQAKLGGAGLALVALLSVEQIEPDFTPLDELRGLGRFLVFMQKSDGSFYSKFFPESGRSDAWQSMYYPGEATLGLLMLHEHDPAPQWWHTSTKALQDLARRGAEQKPTLPDQWFLLSVERWWPQAAAQSDPASRERILEHLRRLCRDMISDQQGQLGVPPIRGCYTPEGRSCPSATRLEGLLAALAVLPPEDEQLRQEIRRSVQLGLQFLLRCQRDVEPHLGAVTRVVPGFVAVQLSAAEKKRAGEVRIDYVQHALSAMLAYERLFSSPVAVADTHTPKASETD